MNFNSSLIAFTAVLGLALFTVASGFGVTSHFFEPETELRSISDAELSRFIGADSDGGPGYGGPKDCFWSPANCSNILPCRGPGAHPCTSCAPGPGSNICRNAQIHVCSSTGVVNCTDGFKGTCFAGACVLGATVQQCGVHFICS